MTAQSTIRMRHLMTLPLSEIRRINAVDELMLLFDARLADIERILRAYGVKS